MKEITENVLPTSPIAEVFDHSTMRATKPGLKRLSLTFSVLCSFIIGFPFLWKTVEIYRSPLPFAEIDALADGAVTESLQFPYRFQAVFLSPNPELAKELDPAQLSFSILTEISKFFSEAPRCGSSLGNVSLSIVVDSSSGDGNECRRAGATTSYDCGSITYGDFDSLDEQRIDETLERIMGSDMRVYSVVVMVVDDKDEEGLKRRVVVGKHRHAWVMAARGSELENTVAEIMVKVFVDGGRREGSINPEFIPVGADGRIILSFNLLNSDPRDWIYDWDFQNIDEALLTPVVEALSPIANITVESQVRHYAPKSSFSSWDGKLRGYVVRTGDLPFFVNSNEWHLDTSIGAGGRSKILQFVVYIPSAKECPLRLILPNGRASSTNGFISPMWGGVMIWNSFGCMKTPEATPSKHVLSPEDLHDILEVLLGQLRQLLGLKSNMAYLGSSGEFSLLSSFNGFSDWEIDFLSRQHTCFNLNSTATTLQSLSRLVKSLPRMIIIDEIGKQVKVSLEAAKLALENASLGIYNVAAASSRQARSLAEDAFYHPSITSVSYYSFEHCFAVYSPFFLPVLMHVVLAAVKEWRRFKHEKAKFLLWKKNK